jgi:hypothetical protein
MTVTLHITSKAKNFIHMPGRQQTSKSLAASTATAYAAAKHMLFLPTLTLPARKPIGAQEQQNHGDLYSRNHQMLI